MTGHGLAFALAVGALLGGCSADARPDKVELPRTARFRPATLDVAIGGEWRSEGERAQDAWRRPEETLRFLGLRPGQTVVEVWPGAGWCTQILAPYLAQTGGRLYAAHPSAGTTGAQGEELMRDFRARLASRPDLYGRVKEGRFGARPGELGPEPGTADLVLFPERLHH